MLQMMQLISIPWARPSFLPAGATLLGCATAVVQLLLQYTAVDVGQDQMQAKMHLYTHISAYM